MHTEAFEYLQIELKRAPGHVSTHRVLEFGSRDVNGSPRLLCSGVSRYVGVDIEPGNGVDIVGDAADVQVGLGEFSVVICAEVLEHTPRWKEIVANMYRHLEPGGVALITAATDPREPHSAVDGWDLRDGEYYGNIAPTELVMHMTDCGFDESKVTFHPRGDVYARGVRHEEEALPDRPREE